MDKHYLSKGDDQISRRRINSFSFIIATLMIEQVAFLHDVKSSSPDDSSSYNEKTWTGFSLAHSCDFVSGCSMISTVTESTKG